jgi:phage terminase small subunit
MDWHELEKMKVNELRDMAKEKSSLEGVTGMTKEHLVEELAKALGIHKPHKVAMGKEKTAIKKQIREVKTRIALALEEKDSTQLRSLRKYKHGLRRKLKRHVNLVG